MDGADAGIRKNLPRDDQNIFETNPPLRRSSRKIQLRARYRDHALITSMLNVVEPSNYKEASQYSEWRVAMEEEYKSTLKNKS